MLLGTASNPLLFLYENQAEIRAITRIPSNQKVEYSNSKFMCLKLGTINRIYSILKDKFDRL